MCFEELHERVVCTFPCQHAICLHCLLSLHAPACPLCRRDLIPCLPLRARLPVLQFVRRRLFANQASLSDGDANAEEDSDLHTPPLSRSVARLGHFPRSPLVAPSETNARLGTQGDGTVILGTQSVRPDGTAILREPSSPLSEEEPV